jgi:deazaflavin-dependent oxidoreductase (nitroreductase family)
MALEGEYEPNAQKPVADQVALYEESGGTQGDTMNGRPVVILTMRGAKSGKIRKVPVMRVTDGTRYAAVASLGGAPRHPVWYHNLVTHPDEVRVQDGPVAKDYTAREVQGSERDEWWKRAVDAYHEYADYQKKTDRLIPVFVLEPKAG